MCCGFLMELELILREYRPSELSHYKVVICGKYKKPE